MQWALGVLGWSPKQFWSSTPIELRCAIKGWKIANGVDEEVNDKGQSILSKDDVDELKQLMEDHGD